MESSKSIFASIVAAGILGTTAVAWAQPGSCDGSGPKAMRSMDGKHGMMRSGMKFDPAARAEQHLDRLKSELKPTAQQEPLWTAFAEKVRAEAGSMQAMRGQGATENLTAPERMARMNAMMQSRLASHQSVTESFTRFYDSLTAEQKAIADRQMSRMGPMDHGRRPGRGGMPAPQGQGSEGERRQG
jgi:hypothetical protein